MGIVCLKISSLSRLSFESVTLMRVGLMNLVAASVLLPQMIVLLQIFDLVEVSAIEDAAGVLRS